MRVWMSLLIVVMAVSLFGQTYVIDEGFEGGALPENWTQEYMNGSLDWAYDSGGHNGHPAAAHTGDYNALLYWDDTDAVTTRLITPAFNISGSSSTLKFWHTQALWENDQDDLNVYFQADAVSDWVIIASYTESITEWTEEEITLPEGSGTSRIAFEGVAKYGWGVCLDDVTIEALGPEYEQDLMAVTVTGDANPSVGDPYEYFVTVKNVGSETQSDFLVQLTDESGNVIDEVDGNELAYNEEEVYELEWTPEETGSFTLRGNVVLDNDENPGNNATVLFPVTVHPYGTIVISVGEGTDTSYRIPVNVFYKSSLTETMYYPDELAVEGEINAIDYYNSFTSTVPSVPVTIWMGETELPSLAGGWIPADELTQVFSGVITFLPGENTINIPLQDSYYYSGGNLVIMLLRPFDDDYYETTDTFFVSEDPENYPDRTIRWQSDTDENDPYDPDTGTLDDRFPNTTFYFTAGSATGIMGVISDQNGNPVGGIEVSLDQTSEVTTTNPEGFFQFYGLDDGTYSISYAKDDYFEGSEADIVLGDGEMIQLELDIMEKLDIDFQIAVNTEEYAGIMITGVTSDGLYAFEVYTDETGAATVNDVYPEYYNLYASRMDLTEWTLNNVQLFSNLDVNINMNESIMPPHNLSCSTEGVFVWQSPYEQLVRNSSGSKVIAGSRYLQEYNVYLDGEFVASTTDTTYTFDPETLVIDQSYTASVSAVFENGESERAEVDFVFEGVGVSDSPDVAVATGIKGIYPNPFNPETNIEFSLDQPGQVVLEIFNVRGQKVKTLVKSPYDSGSFSIRWKGQDDGGKAVSSGIYYLRMTVGNRQDIRKMMLLK